MFHNKQTNCIPLQKKKSLGRGFTMCEFTRMTFAFLFLPPPPVRPRTTREYFAIAIIQNQWTIFYPKIDVVVWLVCVCARAVSSSPTLINDFSKAQKCGLKTYNVVPFPYIRCSFFCVLLGFILCHVSGRDSFKIDDGWWLCFGGDVN